MFQAIYIQLLPSKLILGLLSGVSIVCCLIIIILPVSVIFKLTIIALILLSSVYFILRDTLLMLPWSWQIIAVDSKGGLTITNKRGEQFQPTLADTSFINVKLTILNFGRKSFWLTLPPVIILPMQDNIEDYRRLQIWLRWGRHHKKQHHVDLLAAND